MLLCLGSVLLFMKFIGLVCCVWMFISVRFIVN